MTVTVEALARLTESDPATAELLTKFWDLSFGTLTSMAFDAQLNEAGLVDSTDKDVQFVIEMIKRNIASQ